MTENKRLFKLFLSIWIYLVDTKEIREWKLGKLEDFE